MNKLLKRIADLILFIVALLGILSYLPIQIEGKDILIISGMMFFIVFVILITQHTSKLEEKIDEIEKKFKRADDLIEIKSDIKLLKNIRKIR